MSDPVNDLLETVPAAILARDLIQTRKLVGEKNQIVHEHWRAIQRVARTAGVAVQGKAAAVLAQEAIAAIQVLQDRARVSDQAADAVEPIMVQIGRAQVAVGARTPQAVLAAARISMNALNVEDLREIAEWTGYVNENVWIPYVEGDASRSDLTLVGILAVRIACALVDVDYPDDIVERSARTFVQQVRRAAPRVC